MKSYISLCVMLLIHTSGYGQQKHIYQKDTTYVRGIHYKTIGDTAFELLFKSNGKENIVYSRKVTDGAEEELIIGFNYRSDSLDYACFHWFDDVAGTTWSILWNRKSNCFYLTDHYNLSAGDDSIIRNSVNFKKKEVIIYNSLADFDNKNNPGNPVKPKAYKVKLTQIWPKRKN